MNITSKNCRDPRFGFPRIVLWYATEKCDVGCKHCCYPPKNTKELNTDEAKVLISKLSKVDVKYFGFIGGEPLLRDDIIELCKFCSEVGLKPYVVTKGGKLVERGEKGEELAKELRRAGVKVTVAIDGITHSTIDAICEAPEVYERVMEGRRSVIVLPRPWDFMPKDIARFLIDNGVSKDLEVMVFENLTLREEKAYVCKLSDLLSAEHDDLSIVILRGASRLNDVVLLNSSLRTRHANEMS